MVYKDIIENSTHVKAYYLFYINIINANLLIYSVNTTLFANKNIYKKT